MGNADYYLHGSNNVICDRCGFKFKAHEVRREWTGLLVCKVKCWEARHPQDRLRSRPDKQRAHAVSSEGEDTFQTVVVQPGDL